MVYHIERRHFGSSASLTSSTGAMAAMDVIETSGPVALVPFITQAGCNSTNMQSDDDTLRGGMAPGCDGAEPPSGPGLGHPDLSIHRLAIVNSLVPCSLDISNMRVHTRVCAGAAEHSCSPCVRVCLV